MATYIRVYVSMHLNVCMQITLAQCDYDFNLPTAQITLQTGNNISGSVWDEINLLFVLLLLLTTSLLRSCLIRWWAAELQRLRAKSVSNAGRRKTKKTAEDASWAQGEVPRRIWSSRLVQVLQFLNANIYVLYIHNYISTWCMRFLLCVSISKSKETRI